MLKFEGKLHPDKVSVADGIGHCWVAGLLIDGYPCWFIGGFGIADPRVYGTYLQALAALAHALSEETDKKSIEVKPLSNLELTRPPGYDYHDGRYVLELVGSKNPTFFAVGANGPLETVQKNGTSAFNRARSLRIQGASVSEKNIGWAR